MGRMEAKAFVEGKLACQATLTCQIVPKVREAQAAASEVGPEARPEATAEAVAVETGTPE
jgi:hypothetical protein